MTDRVQALTVTLEADVRIDEDFLANLITAIQTLRGVLEVTPCIVDVNSYTARGRAKVNVLKRLWEIYTDFALLNDKND